MGSYNVTSRNRMCRDERGHRKVAGDPALREAGILGIEFD